MVAPMCCPGHLRTGVIDHALVELLPKPGQGRGKSHCIKTWARIGVFYKDSEFMHVCVALYGAARIVIGQPLVDVSFDASSITLGQLLERLIAVYPRARPYLLDAAGMLPSYMRVLINDARPDPDVTLATVLHDEDRIALLVAVAGG
jgi:molybdopterin converting factor small subunit